MAEEKDEAGVTPFGCGCVLTCEIIEGEKTATLEACDDADCFVRKTFEKESRQQNIEPIYGRKDLKQ